MVLFPFTQSQRKKKKCVEREEEDGDDGFIPIHLVAKKKKMGLKDKKRTGRKALFPFTH